MSSRPQFNPQPVFNAATGRSMAVNITSIPTIIQKLSMISYAYSWTGTSPVGTVSVQVSNDYSQNSDGTVRTAGTWNTMTVNYNGTLVTTVPVTGNTGNGFIDIDQCAGYAIRTIYTAGSGVGTIDATINAKVA